MIIPPINVVMTGGWFMTLFYPHMEDHGRSWKIMEDHGRSWKIMEDPAFFSKIDSMICFLK